MKHFSCARRYAWAMVLLAGLPACSSILGFEELPLRAQPDASAGGNAGRADANAGGNAGRADASTVDAANPSDRADATAGRSVDGAPDDASVGRDATLDVEDDASGGCVTGATRKCAEDPALHALGNCGEGTETCTSGVWSACSVAPQVKDTCTPNDDANCNGTKNDGCPCVDGTTQTCGPEIGECHRGTQTCTGSAWGPCVGGVPAKPRDCTSPLDLDCDGFPDNKVDAVCKCAPGTMQACDTHPGKDGKGPCHAGSQTCVAAADKKTSAWAPCSVGVGPSTADTCEPNNDNNCNGMLNEGCTCVNGATRTCGSDVGNCVAGKQSCVSSAWAATCVGETKPAARDCTTPGDHDCVNGEDQMELGCTTPCKLGGPLGTCATGKQGSCAQGTQTCVASSTKSTVQWGPCVSPTPAPNDAVNCGVCGKVCSGPSPAGSGVAICTNGSCGKSCDAMFHACTGNDAVCYADADVAHCGVACADCRQANATARCGGTTCANVCARRTLVDCGSTGGKPACGSWDFESEGTQRWVHVAPAAGIIDGWNNVFTTRAVLSGNLALAIGHNDVGATSDVDSTVAVDLCPGKQAVDIAGAAFYINVYIDPTVGGDTDTTGESSFSVRASTLTGDVYPSIGWPSYPLLPARTWVKVSVNLSGVASSAVTRLEIKFSTHPDLGSWSGTIYYDDLRIE